MTSPATRRNATQTAGFSSTLLAKLCRIDPDNLGRKDQQLPEANTVQTGKAGGQPKAYAPEQVIDWALARTEGLTELECRLMVAMMSENKRKPVGVKPDKVYYTVLADDGESYQYFHDMATLTPAEQARHVQAQDEHNTKCREAIVARRMRRHAKVTA